MPANKNKHQRGHDGHSQVIKRGVEDGGDSDVSRALGIDFGTGVCADDWSRVGGLDDLDETENVFEVRLIHGKRRDGRDGE